MRTLLIIACLASIAFAFGSLPWQPDAFAFAVLISVFVSLLTALAFVVASMSFLSMPWTWWGTPNRDYWLNEENRPEAIRRCRFFIDKMGVAGMLFILFVQWAPFQIGREVFLAYRNYILAAFLVIITFEFVRYWYSFYRLPKNSEPQEPQV